MQTDYASVVAGRCVATI